MYLPHDKEIHQNDESIAEEINARKKPCIYHTRVKYRKTKHQSYKDEMHEFTMYVPQKGEIQQNDASNARGRNASKHNVLTAQEWNASKHDVCTA